MLIRAAMRMFGKHRPRVVVLSLCFSGRDGPDCLLRAGVGSVIAIQADVPIADRGAILFNQQLIDGFLRGLIIKKDSKAALLITMPSIFQNLVVGSLSQGREYTI